jgi:CO/xanthine dehydrogenase Mo-binding subunit
MAVVGQSVPVLDARERVTGQVRYVLDAERPGMLAGHILRSPHAHARLVRVDASRAAALPGVHAVLTRADLDEQAPYNARYGRVYRDQGIVAIDRVRFVGDPVAAVAAVDGRTAEAALDLIDVEYEPLAAVFDVEAALQPDAPLLYEPRLAPQPGFAALVGDLGSASNLCSHFKLRHGDVQQGFAAADIVFEDTFRSPAVQHVPLEPHVTVAEFENGQLTVWSSTQMPHAIRAQLAELFRLPLTRVRVIVPMLGGGFGAKGSLRLEPITSLLALKARRPVKIVLRREEEFLTVTKHAATVRLRTGVMQDGTVIARQVTGWYNTGAYADVGPIVARNGGSAMGGPYRTPHVHVDSYAVWTNVVPAAAFRGFGVPQIAWAYESQMDMIAERLGLDPVALRRKNVVHDGDRYATGERLEEIHSDALLDSAQAAIQWQPEDARWLRGAPPAPAASLQRGKGLAVVIKATITPSTSTAAVKLNEDGSLDVLTSSVEMGQGAKTVLAQLAADAADLPYERVLVSEPDTAVTPYDQQTSSSRTTYSMGTAVVRAVQDARQRLLALAAELLEVAADDLVTAGGGVAVRGAPDRSLSYGEIIRRSQQGNVLGHGVFVTKGGLDPETGQGIGSVHWHQAAAACEVEVDTETGKIEVLTFHSTVYAGRMVNPRLCELQTEGSTFLGLGQALFEELVYDDGQLVTQNLADYMIPSFGDVPRRVESAILERAGAGEVHGIGETSLPPVAPAVANAVYNATGVRITDLPLTPEKVLRGLHALRVARPAGQ